MWPFKMQREKILITITAYTEKIMYWGEMGSAGKAVVGSSAGADAGFHLGGGGTRDVRHAQAWSPVLGYGPRPIYGPWKL